MNLLNRGLNLIYASSISENSINTRVLWHADPTDVGPTGSCAPHELCWASRVKREQRITVTSPDTF